jgi:hypothetical protein
MISSYDVPSVYGPTTADNNTCLPQRTDFRCRCVMLVYASTNRTRCGSRTSKCFRNAFVVTAC